MLTGAEYKASLNDGRETYFEGERVDDLVGHELLGQTVEITATSYDDFYDPTPGAISPLLGVPQSADDLRELIPLLHHAGMMAHVTSSGLYAQRIVTRRHYDLDAAKRKALTLAGLSEDDAH